MCGDPDLNRTIVECKVKAAFNAHPAFCNLNRTIVECKAFSAGSG